MSDEAKAILTVVGMVIFTMWIAHALLDGIAGMGRYG